MQLYFFRDSSHFFPTIIYFTLSKSVNDSFESFCTLESTQKRGKKNINTAFTHFLMEYNFTIFTSRMHLCERHSLQLVWKRKCTRGKLISTHTLFCRFLHAVVNSKVANLCVYARVGFMHMLGFHHIPDMMTMRRRKKRLTSHIIKSFSFTQHIRKAH